MTVTFLGADDADTGVETVAGSSDGLAVEVEVPSLCARWVGHREPEFEGGGGGDVEREGGVAASRTSR